MLVCPSAPALAWTPSPRDLTPRHRELPSPTLATSAMPATMVTISVRDLLTLMLMLTTATPMPMLVWATMLVMLVWDTMLVMLVWDTMPVMPDTHALPSTPPMFPSAPAPV